VNIRAELLKRHEKIKRNICNQIDGKEFLAEVEAVAEFRLKLLEVIENKYTVISGSNDSKKVKHFFVLNTVHCNVLVCKKNLFLIDMTK